MVELAHKSRMIIPAIERLQSDIKILRMSNRQSILILAFGELLLKFLFYRRCSVVTSFDEGGENRIGGMQSIDQDVDVRLGRRCSMKVYKSVRIDLSLMCFQYLIVLVYSR